MADGLSRRVLQANNPDWKMSRKPVSPGMLEYLEINQNAIERN
jgi:hypothetical protein